MATKTPTQKPPRQKPREITEEEREFMSNFEANLWFVFLGSSSILTAIADIFGITVIGLPATFLFDIVPTTIDVAYTVRIALLGQFTMWDGIVNVLTLVVPFASFIKFYVKIKGFKDRAQAVLDRAKKPIQPVARTLSTGLLKRQATQTQEFQGNIATAGRINDEKRQQEIQEESTQSETPNLTETTEEILNPVEQEVETQIFQIQPQKTRGEEQIRTEPSLQTKEIQKESDLTTKEEELAVPTGETYFSPRPQEEYEKTIQNESRKELVNEKTVIENAEIPQETAKKSVSGIAVAGRRITERTAEFHPKNTPLEEEFVPLQSIKQPEKEEGKEIEPLIKARPAVEVNREEQAVLSPTTSPIAQQPEKTAPIASVPANQPETLDFGEISGQIAKLQEITQRSQKPQNISKEVKTEKTPLPEEKSTTFNNTEVSIPAPSAPKEKKERQTQVVSADIPIYEDIISRDEYRPEQQTPTANNRGGAPQQSVTVRTENQNQPQNEPEVPEYVANLENELGLGENNLGKKEDVEQKTVRITASEQKEEERDQEIIQKPTKPNRVTELEERFKENKRIAKEQEKTALEGQHPAIQTLPHKNTSEKQSEVTRIEDKIRAKKEAELQKERETRAQRIAAAEKKFAEDIENQDPGFEKKSNNVVDLRKKEEGSDKKAA